MKRYMTGALLPMLAAMPAAAEIDYDGVEFEGSLTAVVQKVSRGGTPEGDAQTRGSYRGDVTASLPLGSPTQSNGLLFAHVRFGQGEGVSTRPTYTGTVNSTSFENSDNDDFAVLAQAWYQRAIPVNADAGRVVVTVGKIDAFGFFDQNRVADDESMRFLNNVFVHNPLLDSGGDIGADDYGFAPGAIAKVESGSADAPDWALSLGVFGTGEAAKFKDDISHPFVIVQAEKAMIFGGLAGSYRLYAWTNGQIEDYDGELRRHSGFGLSVDQNLSEDLVVFGRYGHETLGQVSFDRAITVGVELGGSAWNRGADAVGFAVGDLRTSSGYRADSLAVVGYEASGSERDVELYYRYEFNKMLHVTPDFQWIRHPGGDSTAATIKVAALRAKVSF